MIFLLIGALFFLGYLLWAATDGIRMLTCGLEPISGIPTTGCYDVYRQSALQ